MTLCIDTCTYTVHNQYMSNRTSQTEAQYLTAGTLIIPEGRKRPVEILAIYDRPATVEVYGVDRQAFIFPRGQMITTVAPTFA